MKICIIGDGLASLTLANVLVQKDIFVDIYSAKKILCIISLEPRYIKI